MVLNDSPSIAATVELKNAITISTVPSFVKSIRTGGFITPNKKEVLIQCSQLQASEEGLKQFFSKSEAHLSWGRDTVLEGRV